MYIIIIVLPSAAVPVHYKVTTGTISQKLGAAVGWPTNYEEVTPLCDSVSLDIKFYANLDGKSCNHTNKYLANAGHRIKQVVCKMSRAEFEVFTGPYNTEHCVKTRMQRI